ncbi:MAG: NADPH-dependent F420 reductase [Gammaproteobacteria bacterium]|nr:NADPH-dependent F420 reductase [Gammaproteobacteria bacterium]MYI76483.1 NADPH-dependent F420 reductase [Gammaproteobacteria bacterium]
MNKFFSTNNPDTIAILGGTGDVGTGFTLRWGKSGHKIIIGSRTRAKAETAVAKLLKSFPNLSVVAMENREAAETGDIVVLTVPAAHQISTLATVKDVLKGKILVDATVPLMPPKVGTVQLPNEGSAGKRAQELLGDDVMVVSAFQNIAADLMKTDVDIECDVLVSGNKKVARERVIQLAKDAGMQAWHAGPIDNAAAAEALTSILIQINKRYPISHSGIKIVGGRHD